MKIPEAIRLALSGVKIYINNVKNELQGKINNINETKADKSELFSKDYNDLINTPCGDTREYETINCPIIFDGNLTDKVVAKPEDASNMETMSSSLVKSAVIPSLVKVADVAPIINLPVNEGDVIAEMIKNRDLIVESCVVQDGKRYVSEQGCIYQGYTFETYETTDSYIAIYDDSYMLIAAFVYEECVIGDFGGNITLTPGIWYTVLLTPEDLSVDSYVERYSITYVVSGEFKKLSREFIDYLPGLNVEGKEFTVSTMYGNNQQDGVLQVAKGGAEIFNDYEGNAATGRYSHAEGTGTMASGDYSHAEGTGTKAIYFGAHAEGNGSIASGTSSHAEGLRTIATGDGSHAEGYETKAFGSRSHAEGIHTEVTKMASDGKNTTYAGHAEGQNTKVTAQYAGHAEGYYTISASSYQHVQGKFNIEDTANTYAHIVGNGTTDTNRSNAHTLDWDGNAWFQGNVSIDGTPVNDNDLTTKKYVDDNKFSKDYNDLTNKPEIPSIEGLATETYVNEAVAGIVDSAPETLDTLNELAQALGDDPNFATTIANQIGQKADKSELFSGSYNDLTNKPEIPSIVGLASETYVNEKVSEVELLPGPKGDQGEQGPIGPMGPEGPAGKDGEDGYTPVKGVDYFTEEDFAALNIPSIEGLATETYVNNTVAGLVDSAPETLNTLNELSKALGDDPNFATTISTEIGKKANSADLATVATSGSYNDLTNKPAIPSIQGLASESYVNQQISKIQHPTYDDTSIKNQIANKADKSELFSGDYEDLSNKPTIPSIDGLATENFVKNEIAKAQLETEGDILVNLDGYATKDDLNLKADKTEVPSIEGLASESYVQQEIAKMQGNGGGSGNFSGEDDVSEEEKEYVDDMMYSSLGGLKFIKITQSRYDALSTKDPNTIYIIVSAENMGNTTGEEGVTDIYNLRWVEGSNLSDTGAVVTNSSQTAYRLSDFIKVNSEYNYRINTSSSAQFQVFYYDKNKNYIGKSTIRNDKTELASYGFEGFIEFPEDVKYLRIRTNDKTSSIEINTMGKRDDSFVPYQFRNGYTVASNGSVSAAAGYMVSGDIKLEPDYDYSITFNGNKTRIVFFNTDGNKTGNCLPSDSTYYNETTTLTRADIPEAAVSFRMRFATGGEITMTNIDQHLKVVKTLKASKYIESITSWMQSKGFDENGEEIDDISAMSTGYIAITSGYDYMYTLKQGVPFGFQIYYYNSNKTFISSSEVQDDPIGNKRFVIPDNAAYFRLKVSQENSLTFDNVNENVEIKKIPAVEGMLYQFGVLSDVHVDAGSDGNFYDHNHATNDYRKALKFLEDEGAEFIAYGGDMATGDPGVSEQDYRKVLELLKNSHIPSYMISGNHDYGYFFKALIESRKYYTVEKGNDMFIFVCVQDRGTTGGVDREIIDGVKALIENNPNKRLFLFYHYFIRNHGSGDGATDVKYYTGDTLGDGYDNYPLSLEWANLIINTPNLIFCHGHSHFRFQCVNVYEYNNYYHADGECHSVHIPSCAAPRTMSADSTSVTNWEEGSEGYMVRVFADRVEFHAVQLSAYRYLTTYNFTINLPEGN